MGNDHIRDIRRERLRDLLAEYEGRQSVLAERLKRSPSQINQWLSGHRTITEDSARAIEERARKPRGWLDHESAASAPKANGNIPLDDVQKVAAIYADLSPTERHRFLHLLAASRDDLPALGVDLEEAWNSWGTERTIDGEPKKPARKRRLG